MYRFRFEENNQTLRPDPRSSTPRFWKIDNWKVTAEFTVDDRKIMADALRALADKLYLPQSEVQEKVNEK
jgi:hypothetical protein